LKKEITIAATSAVALIMLFGGVSYLLFPQASVQESKASIDVYTQKGGQGKDQQGGNFAPLEWMNLSAEVKDASNKPLGSRLVSFEIHEPTNITTGASISIMGVATTNSSGIAIYSFRIPPSDATNSIGRWLVYVNVPVDDQVLVDTLTFLVE
jgi:hypothetical protein